MSEGTRMPVLFLRLEGPLQSWGDDAQWSVRRSRGEPSKSGVIGILAAALGCGPDAEGDAQVARLGQELRLGVRADRPGSPLRDYHTVYGGVLSAEGKIKINASTREPETVVSERYYLADACFLAALTGPAETLEQLRSALEDPVWCPFLGRKSCPPSSPIWPALPGHTSLGEFTNLQEALEAFPVLDGWGPAKPSYQAAWELAPGAALPERGIRLPRRDVPLSFRHRRFGLRYVCEAPVYPPSPQGEA